MDEASKNIVSHKIMTVDEVAAAIGKRPRDKKVIMCHGTFDIVHPGHIRHLLYAKSKADILVTSLTCDDHIVKANFRPFVPEELRAHVELEIAHYTRLGKIFDYEYQHHEGLTRPQAEIVAGRVSALNDCFY